MDFHVRPFDEIRTKYLILGLMESTPSALLVSCPSGTYRIFISVSAAFTKVLKGSWLLCCCTTCTTELYSYGARSSPALKYPGPSGPRRLPVSPGTPGVDFHVRPNELPYRVTCYFGSFYPGIVSVFSLALQALSTVTGHFRLQLRAFRLFISVSATFTTVLKSSWLLCCLTACTSVLCSFPALKRS